MSDNFNNDLTKGKYSEIELRDLLIKNGNKNVFVTDGDCPYDLIWIKGDNILTIEVKTDFLCRNTGNVAFETHYKGAYSGVFKSKCDFIVYKIFENFYIQKTKIIKEWLSNSFYKNIHGGDNKESTMKLVPLKYFKTKFKKITTKDEKFKNN